jgi:hypothetical protein
VYLYIKKKKGERPRTTHATVQPVTIAHGKEKTTSSLLTHPSKPLSGMP